MTIVKGQVVTATIVAQDTGTERIHLNEGQRASISLGGVVDSTITLQHRYRVSSGGAFAVAWSDVAGGAFTTNIDSGYLAAEEVEVRLHCKTGDYGSDTVAARLGAQGVAPA